jgi:ADP-heptose:LPS heptosyltransferase
VEPFQRIIISRTDKIGDVILTLPLVGFLKENYPNSEIIFIGNTYTKPILESCENIDKIIDWHKIKKLPIQKQLRFFKRLKATVIIHVFPNKRIAFLAKWSGIKTRIGTSHRVYHLFTVNKKVNLGRKNSEKHEAELNLELLKPLHLKYPIPTKNELTRFYGLTKIAPLPERFVQIIDRNKFNLILHPKSKGSAREWGLNKYAELIRVLPENKYNIIVAGTPSEADEMEYLLKVYASKIKDVTGKLSLSEYISLINEADGMVACSTGPLHIAAALGKRAIGIYAPMRPIFPQRWGPIGSNSTYLVIDKECNDCKTSSHCQCIEAITVEQVVNELNKSELKR